MRGLYFFLLVSIMIVSGCNSKYGVISQKIVDRDIAGAKQLISAAKTANELNELNEDNLGATPLHLAAMNGDLDLVNSLIKKGFDINSMGGNKWATPLMAASHKGQVDIIESLILNNALINVKNWVGYRAIHFAAAAGHVGALELLIKHKAKLQAATDNGRTPLSKAIESNKINAVKYLVKKGADINSLDKGLGVSELALAAIYGKNIEIVKFLLDQGADINLSRVGSTPVFEALNNRNYEIAAYLIANSADTSIEIKDKTLTAHGWSAEKIMTRDGVREKVYALVEKFKLEKEKEQILVKQKAKEKLQFVAANKAVELKNKQKCFMKEKQWIYLSKACKGKYANGKGVALHYNGELKFKGVIKSGLRTSGVLSYAGTPMFDGSLKDGRPNGKGICFHEGEPEECKYYKGKRVDVIYKQRMANIKQQRAMDAKMAEMKRMQDEQNKKINRIQYRVDSNQSATQSGGGIGQQIGDYALRKAGEKVMDSLFDRLF